MTRLRSIHEAASEVAMSIEGFAETDAYKQGVADGTIEAWSPTGPTPEAEAEAEPAAKAKHSK